jgi:hypothetical protein
MRWICIVALLLSCAPAEAQMSTLNNKCEATCRVALDRCSVVFDRIMDTALKEMTPYRAESVEKARADIRFEAAFEAGEKCRGRYSRCVEKCQPPKGCIKACLSTFKKCFADGKRLVYQGLRDLRKLKYDSPEWKAAYAKGDSDIEHCLDEDRSCEAKCANP